MFFFLSIFRYSLENTRLERFQQLVVYAFFLYVRYSYRVLSFLIFSLSFPCIDVVLLLRPVSMQLLLSLVYYPNGNKHVFLIHATENNRNTQ